MILIKLEELLNGYVSENVLDFDVDNICIDSRKIKDGSLYICLNEEYIHDVDFNLNIIVLSSNKYNDKTIAIDNISDIYLSLIHRFYGDCSKKVKIVGVTGTNGKTTIAYSLHKIVKNSMYIGTLHVSYSNKIIYTENTTPSLIDILEYINDAINYGVKYVFMEVSSHALTQDRVGLIDFDGAIFTNLTQDHLDYHKDMEEYFIAKKKLFDGLKSDSFAVINVDDDYGRKIYKDSIAKVIRCSYFDITNSKYTSFNSEITFSSIKLKYKLIGSFNAYNIMSIYYVLKELGFKKKDIIKGIKNLECVPGRMDRYNTKEYNIFIDYAHTPDALAKALYELKNICNGKLHVVFGCGGNRDKTKRSKMGEIACREADYIYLTNDNPRYENELDIIENISSGIVDRKKLYINPNRYESIEYAIRKMNKEDILLVAGKGVEDYMIINGEKKHYSDMESIKCILNH